LLTDDAYVGHANDESCTPLFRLTSNAADPIAKDKMDKEKETRIARSGLIGIIANEMGLSDRECYSDRLFKLRGIRFTFSVLVSARHHVFQATIDTLFYVAVMLFQAAVKPLDTHPLTSSQRA
jgi:hypothetical protein